MFYKIDSSRVSFREYWWGTRSPLVLIGWLVKVLHIPLPSSTDDPPVDSLHPFEVASETLPEAVCERLQPVMDELAACGFHSPVCYAIEDAFHATKIYRIMLCHESERAVACVHYRIWGYQHPPKHVLFPMFLTEFNDGTFLVSSAGKADLDAPASVHVNRAQGAGATQLWASHQQVLAQETTEKLVEPVRNADDVRALAERHHAVLRDFHLKRGVFKPMTGAESQRAAALNEAVKASEQSGLEHADVLAQLNQIQDKRAGWGSAVLILAVSILLFVGAGAARWSWQIVLLLIPILLFHEFGHYVAMRIFDYRNVRMFFIPLFGAAVTGRNYNVAGWKKAVVSLMGPLPGIALGIVLGFAGFVLHTAWLTKLAMLALILNGFNLLPVLPLDGGWVMHAILFSRHYLLDVGFRALAVLALIAGGTVSQDRVLTYLGIFMVVGLLPAYRLARIAGQLRQRGLLLASPDDQTIPTDTAQTIITEVKRAFPKRVTNRALAQYTLQVFETLNARPPGWAASFALLFVHVLSGVAALVFAGVFMLWQRGDLRDMVAAAAAGRAQHKLACNSDLTWQGADLSALLTTAHNTLIATFATRAEAESALGSFTNRLPARAAARVFGSTLMVALPADDGEARKQWLGEIELVNSNVFVTSTNFPATISLTCIAPNEAVAAVIQEEAQEYLAAPASLHLIPPWMAHDTRTPAERARHKLARRTYAKLLEADSKRFQDPAVAALQKRIAQAYKRGDEGEVMKVRDEMKDLYAELKKRGIETFRREGGAMVDTAVIDLYAAMPSDPSTNADYRAALDAIGAQLGQVSIRDGHPAPSEMQYSARWGDGDARRACVELPVVVAVRWV